MELSWKIPPLKNMCDTWEWLSMVVQSRYVSMEYNKKLFCFVLQVQVEVGPPGAKVSKEVSLHADFIVVVSVVWLSDSVCVKNIPLSLFLCVCRM